MSKSINHRRVALKRLILPLATTATMLALNPSFLQAQTLGKPATVAQSIASRITQVNPQSFTSNTRVDGTAIVHERPKISSQTSGVISALNVEIGQYLEKGDLLFEIDSPEVEFGYNAATAELARVKAIAAQKQNHANRQASLRKQDLVSKSTAEDALFDARAANQAVEAAEAQVKVWQTSKDKLQIRAPFDAQVVDRHVTLGDYVNPGKTVATLVQPDLTVIEMAVPERAMRGLEIGSNVMVYLGTGEQYASVVSRISPVVDVATRTVLVHVAPALDSNLLVRPGTSAQVELANTISEVYAVPESSIVSEKDKTFVFTLDENNVASRQDVSVHSRTRGLVLISKGLTPNSRIAVDAAFVRNGATIREVL